MSESTRTPTPEQVDRATLDAIVERSVTGPWGLSEATQAILREAFSRILRIPSTLMLPAFDERLSLVGGAHRLLEIDNRNSSQFSNGRRVRVLINDRRIEISEGEGIAASMSTKLYVLSADNLVAVLGRIPGFVLVSDVDQATLDQGASLEGKTVSAVSHIVVEGAQRTRIDFADGTHQLFGPLV